MNFWERYSSRRQLKKLRNEIRQQRHADDDLLTPDARAGLDALIDEIATADAAAGAICDKASVRAYRERFRQFHPAYRFQSVRGWLDLLLVVGAVAFGIRALYLQPFRIPTSSMQPTLYGIHYIDREQAVYPLLEKLPPPLRWLVFSARRAHLTVESPGYLRGGRQTGGAFSPSTAFRIGDREYVLPGTLEKTLEYAALDNRRYQTGDVAADGYLSLGDHLFVERFSLYLAPIKRGDIMVFTTVGLQFMDRPLAESSGHFYIKRLAGLPGDRLKIVDDELWVQPAGAAEFQRIRDLAPVFDKLYSGKGGYQGHIGNMPRMQYLRPGQVYTVPENNYFMLGDNSTFSLDSRFFGGVPRENLIGKAWIAFWPFSRRWGLIDHVEPLDVPTGTPSKDTFPVMYMQ